MRENYHFLLFDRSLICCGRYVKSFRLPPPNHKANKMLLPKDLHYIKVHVKVNRSSIKISESVQKYYGYYYYYIKELHECCIKLVYLP